MLEHLLVISVSVALGVGHLAHTVSEHAINSVLFTYYALRLAFLSSTRASVDFQKAGIING